jgi:hypothetical protein
MSEEISRKIHTYLGKGCWHRPSHYIGHETEKFWCMDCGLKWVPIEHLPPDYCNSLDALRPVELKVIEEFGSTAYATQLIRIFKEREDSQVHIWAAKQGIGLIATADAPTRARAVCEVISK